MAKKESEGIVEPKTKETSTELVEVKGVTLDLWKDTDTTFIPDIKKGMSPALRAEKLREVAKKSTHLEDRLHAVMGESLYEINKNECWKEWTYSQPVASSKSGEVLEDIKYKSFREYVEIELDVTPRTAYYYIEVYEKFVMELGISPATLRGLDWSKAKVLCPIVDKSNYKDILKDTKDLSVRATREYVSKKKGKKKTSKSGSGTFSRMSFNLTDEQTTNIQDALAIAGAMTDSEKTGHQLDMICTSFVADSAGSDVSSSLIKLDQCIKSLERTFAVKIEIIEVSDDRYGGLGDAIESDEMTEKEVEV